MATRGWDAESGYLAGTDVVSDPAVTAVFVANIMSAIRVMRAAREVGRQVLSDLSVICLHDSPVAAYFDPPLTTVTLPLRDLGRAAVQMLLERISGSPARDAMLPDAPQLIERGSTRMRALPGPSRTSAGDPTGRDAPAPPDAREALDNNRFPSHSTVLSMAGHRLTATTRGGIS